MAAFLLVVGLVPASAMAGGTDAPCTAVVETTQDETVANISIECEDGTVITNANLRLNERNEGRVEGEEGNAECQPDEVSLEFNCQPSAENDGSSIRAQLTADDSDPVCADPRLMIDFTIEFEEGDTQEINDVEVAPCSEGGDEDAGAVPEGGVDSGIADAAVPSAGTDTALPIAGAALLALALVSAGRFLRKTRTTP